MKRRLGLLLIFCLLITLSGCQMNKDIGLQSSESIEKVTEPTLSPEAIETPKPTDAPKPTDTPAPTAIPKPTATPMPAPSTYTLVEVPSEDIAYWLEEIISFDGKGGYFEQCNITENGFYMVYDQNQDQEQFRLDHYDTNGNFQYTTYQLKTEPLPAYLSLDEYRFEHEYEPSYVVKVSHDEQTITPVMGLAESDITSTDAYYMDFIGPMGTDGMLFETWTHHFAKDIRLYKKVLPENVSYVCTLGVISTDFSKTTGSPLTATYNRYHQDGRIKVINYLEEGETPEQAFEKLRADLIKGNGPDLLSLDKEKLEILYRENLLTDLSKEPKISAEDILPGVREFFSVDSGLYAVPTRISIEGLILPKEYEKNLAGKSFRELREWSTQNNADLFRGYTEPYELLSLMIDLDMDEYIDINTGTYFFGEEFMDNLNYIDQFKYVNEYDKIMHMEYVGNMAGATVGTELFLDDTLGITGLMDGGIGSLQIWGTPLAVSKNASNKEGVCSYLNWYLSGDEHLTDVCDEYELPPTISGCRKQQNFFAEANDWYVPEAISSEAAERLIAYLQTVRVPVFSEEKDTLEQIVFGEGMAFLEGGITIEQATENIRAQVQDFLEKR